MKNFSKILAILSFSAVASAMTAEATSVMGEPVDQSFICIEHEEDLLISARFTLSDVQGEGRLLYDLAGKQGIYEKVTFTRGLWLGDRLTVHAPSLAGGDQTEIIFISDDYFGESYRFAAQVLLTERPTEVLCTRF